MSSNRRRRKTSAFEDLVALVALLPWWVGVMLAVVSYVVLSTIAKRPVPAAQPGQMAALVTGTLTATFASIGQYLLPLICLLGAGVSAWKRRERTALAEQASGPRAAQAIDGMSWREFERLVGEAYRLRGYRVQETGGGGADGGVDLVLVKGSETWLVQCKQWRAQMVGVDIVRQLYGVMAARGATGGFVVTSGHFSDDAAAFAKGRNVELVDGPALQRMLAQAKVGAQRSQVAATPVPAKAPAAQAAHACPQCAGPMIQRTAARGANAGKAFWGCATYPKCRGTRATA
ncbi:restriction endonuclease [Rivibacter subsaxonicus]|uniref:Restriction system protein n=1 Tax=Rivibacter subsaxonicus TaxID=457575 RepID=A0A4V6MEQ8_9BURK|nr:restriction endonuclease [Rivibacter subsaxonicus]RZU02246.1 restriction system protein [Rivibacter subsaxonicus]